MVYGPSCPGGNKLHIKRVKRYYDVATIGGTEISRN